MYSVLKYGQYFGTVDISFDLNELKLTQTSYLPFSRLPSHYHQNNYLCYVKRGTYSEKFGNRTIHCTRGDLIIHPVQYEHSNTFFSSPVTCLNIELNSSIESYAKNVPYVHTLQKIQDPALSILLAKISSEIFLSDEFSPLVIQGLVIQLFAQMARIQYNFPLKKPLFLKKIEEILNEETGTSLDLTLLAKHAGVHPVHLANTFKKYNNKTIGEFFRELKLEKAISLLISTKLPLAQIAFQCGFSDQSHFTRAFKKYTHHTPTAFRQINSPH